MGGCGAGGPAKRARELGAWPDLAANISAGAADGAVRRGPGRWYRRSCGPARSGSRSAEPAHGDARIDCLSRLFPAGRRYGRSRRDHTRRCRCVVDCRSAVVVAAACGTAEVRPRSCRQPAQAKRLGWAAPQAVAIRFLPRWLERPRWPRWPPAATPIPLAGRKRRCMRFQGSEAPARMSRTITICPSALPRSGPWALSCYRGISKISASGSTMSAREGVGWSISVASTACFALAGLGNAGRSERWAAARAAINNTSSNRAPLDNRNWKDNTYNGHAPSRPAFERRAAPSRTITPRRMTVTLHFPDGQSAWRQAPGKAATADTRSGTTISGTGHASHRSRRRRNAALAGAQTDEVEDQECRLMLSTWSGPLTGGHI